MWASLEDVLNDRSDAETVLLESTRTFLRPECSPSRSLARSSVSSPAALSGNAWDGCSHRRNGAINRVYVDLDGPLYLIMRWVERTDLGRLLTTSGRVSPGGAIKLLRRVASALEAAHRRGLAHRDIRPGNVLVARGDEEDDDHVYVTDFGIARRADGEPVTRAGVFVGRFDGATPERFDAGRGDAVSDINSFGCVLFEALTGHVPCERPTSFSKIYAHVAEPIPSARDEVRRVPDQLDATIAEAMVQRPDDRFGAARELTAALGRTLQALDIGERLAVAPRPRRNATDFFVTTVITEDAATRIESAAPAIQPPATWIEPAPTVNEPARTATAPT